MSRRFRFGRVFRACQGCCVRVLIALDTGRQIPAESEILREKPEDLGHGLALRPQDIEARARMQSLIRVLDLYVTQVSEPLFRAICGRETPNPNRVTSDLAERFELLKPRLRDGKNSQWSNA